MNCLLSTLYAFWKTNSTDQGDYCYLLFYCGSFWTWQLRSGHHCVRHSAPLERELGSARKCFWAEQTRHREGGKGKAELWEGTCQTPGGSCPGVCALAPFPAQSPVCKTTILRRENALAPGIASVDALYLLIPYDVLSLVLPLFPILLLLVALAAEEQSLASLGWAEGTAGGRDERSLGGGVGPFSRV